jgi:hypothetical protein
MAQAKINFENPEMIPKRALQISATVDVAKATFRTSSKGQRPDHRIGGLVVIEPPRPLVRQCGPHGPSHHAAINDRLMRNGGSLTFAR